MKISFTVDYPDICGKGTNIVKLRKFSGELGDAIKAICAQYPESKPAHLAYDSDEDFEKKQNVRPRVAPWKFLD